MLRRLCGAQSAFAATPTDSVWFGQDVYKRQLSHTTEHLRNEPLGSMQEVSLFRMNGMNEGGHIIERAHHDIFSIAINSKNYSRIAIHLKQDLLTARGDVYKRQRRSQCERVLSLHPTAGKTVGGTLHCVYS